MQAKDKFLEKINFLILLMSLFFSHALYAENVYEKIFNYNDKLKNSSVNFIQTNLNDVQEGVIFFGDKRIKINYKKPQKITIILSEKKGIYINHELEESQFFATKNSYIKFLFDVFHKKKYLKNITIEESDDKIEIIDKFKLDNTLYNIKLIYENEPIKLRRLEINDDDKKTQMGFFNHSLEKNFENKFFSMADPYLN
ncbi:outer-membrane lipoprotein carrier protein LolA [Pelagibacteraceae bacterium]|nr:outer-membrane lipoprotein carrier protein LolA [Pelagibacteraceae bacterium]